MQNTNKIKKEFAEAIRNDATEDLLRELHLTNVQLEKVKQPIISQKIQKF